MSNKHIMNYLTIGIVVLFIGTGVIIPSVANKSSISIFHDGNTLYVGGNGTGNYSKIQDAIDNASDGDTVFVYNGTYYENIEVNKSINLIGESKNTTIIDGSDKETVVIISIYDGSLSDFTIQNGNYGITLASSWKIYITNNLITGNRIGIKLVDSVRNIISNNTIEYNSGGIFLWHSSNNNTICYNVIENNSDEDPSYCDAVDLLFSRDNTIANNIISNNEGTGISSYSEHISSKNTIVQNTIIYNRKGVSLSHFSNGFLVSNNTICYNNGMGIYLWNNNNVTIENNIISNNNGTGIYIWSDVHHLNISNNLLAKNTGAGLIIRSSSHIAVFGNNFSDNAYGMFLWGVNRANIRTNNIQGHIEEGLYLLVSNNNLISSNHFEKNTLGINIDSSRNNEITSNNFLNSCRNAFFINGRNKWRSNFWDRPRLLPYPIFGKMILGKLTIPWINFDWRPAQELYEIENV